MISLLTTFAQYSSSYNYDYSSTSSGSSAAAAGLVIGVIFFSLLISTLIYIFMAVCLSKIFKKAGRQDSWAAWVPIYNTWVMAEVSGRPGWWSLLMFIPIANFVVSIIIALDLAKAFGKETVYGLLLAFMPIIGYPMLAFGDAQYQGSSNFGNNTDNNAQPPQTPYNPTATQA